MTGPALPLTAGVTSTEVIFTKAGVSLVKWILPPGIRAGVRPDGSDTQSCGLNPELSQVGCVTLISKSAFPVGLLLRKPQ